MRMHKHVLAKGLFSLDVYVMIFASGHFSHSAVFVYLEKVVSDCILFLDFQDINFCYLDSVNENVNSLSHL
jgi:hypothetical protein